jgi:nucleoid-associated protein YgaU
MLPARNNCPARNGRSRLSWLLCLLPLLLAAPVHSQSLGEVARQERERKQNQARPATHVYTNEDLARPRILLQEDRERVQAAQQKATPAASEPAAAVASSEPETHALPLGDIARGYRALRQARQKLESQSKASQREMGAPALAYPAFPRPLVRTAPPPGPPRFVRPRPLSDKSTRGEELLSGTRMRVQPGDTLWRLAKEHLGRGTDWLLLAAINPQVTDPTRLRVGAWVRLPDKAPALQAVKRIRVARGDSLWKLAKAQFGNGEAWSCIAKANPQLQNPDLIFPTQTVTLPASCSASP